MKLNVNMRSIGVNTAGILKQEKKEGGLSWAGKVLWGGGTYVG